MPGPKKPWNEVFKPQSQNKLFFLQASGILVQLALSLHSSFLFPALADPGKEPGVRKGPGIYFKVVHAQSVNQ